jgi:hypothetical protein
MPKALISGLLIIGLLFLMLNQRSPICAAQSSTFQGWQVENKGGHYSESNDVLRLWSNGGSNCPSIALYRQIKPTSNFTFSVQVNAETAESCCFFIRSNLPTAGSTLGFNFEFGHYGEGIFLLSRNSSNSQVGYGDSNEWVYDQVAYGDPHVWYTMQLSVSSSPFMITASVFDENGTSRGSFSTSDIANFTFADINYIGLSVWGYSPSDYSFRNIKNPFDTPTSISISTLSSSTTTGSTVNVFGTLLDSNGTPLQNKIVVLSYTFLGADSWIPISSEITDENGNYNIQWINSASGTFTIKTEWSGDFDYRAASNTATLSFLPYHQQVFFVESNSTVYDLAFNNVTSTLSFNVTGPSGTTGYVKATISKALLTNDENLQVYIDGKQLLNYSKTSIVDSWVITLDYSHSTHQISINLDTNVSSTQPFGNELILIILIVLLGTILAIITWYLLGLNSKVVKNVPV